VVVVDFLQLTMSSSLTNSLFSIDLVEESKYHIAFLQQLHSLGVTLRPPDPESLRRYREFWLPLVIASSDGDAVLIPPSDIAWLWHCHRLAPFRYKQYVEKTFGREEDGASLEANPPFSFQHVHNNMLDICCGSMNHNKNNTEKVAAATRDLWVKTYPNEPFFLEDADQACTVDSRPEDSKLCGFDLAGSTERQAGFLWQVSGQRFQKDSFLREGVSNYYKFLSLKKVAAPDQFIVPTYQIDLMWHTHILASVTTYDEDCQRIMGLRLHHDDSLNDRSVGGTLDTAFQQTKKLWRKQYGTEYSVIGGMYRGEPPEEYYRIDWGISSNMTMSLPQGALVGRVGASSSATETSGGPVAWLEASLSTTTTTGDPTFIAGSYNSQQKKDYVYGRENQGIGYYHIYTREAYTILERRIRVAIDHKRALIDRRKCFMTVCCQKTPFNLERVEQNERELDELRDILLIVLQRLQSNTPTGSLNAAIPDEIRNDPARLERYNNYVNPGIGHWYMPPAFYDAGGGCGSCPAGGGECCYAACMTCENVCELCRLISKLQLYMSRL
jgi:hypothetical protein